MPRLLLVIAWLLYAAPLSAAQPETPPPPSVETLAEFLRTRALAPEEYIVSLFHRRQLVLLGERHWVRHDAQFVQRLIPRLHAAGIHTLAIEFANADEQAAADALLIAEQFDLDGARRLLFNSSSTWGYVEYIDLYRRAWEVNRARPEGTPPFRIVGLNYAPGWSELRDEMTPELWKKVWYRGSSDEYMAQVAARELLDKGEKALIYCGRHHAFTRFHQPETNEANTRAIRHMDRRLGNLLHQRAGDAVCTVMLHAPWRDRELKAIGPVHALIDRAFDAAGAAPAGFDIPGTPFGDLPDARSLYSVGDPDFRLSNFCDGYVILAPYARAESVTVDEGFITAANIDAARAGLSSVREREELRTPADFIAAMREAADVGAIRETVP